MSEPTYTRVHLPGEGFWAVVLGRVKKGRYQGRLKVRLSNEPLAHGFHWGQVVILGEDDCTVVTPKHAVEAAKREHDVFEEARQEELAQWHERRATELKELSEILQRLGDELEDEEARAAAQAVARGASQEAQEYTEALHELQKVDSTDDG